MSNEIILTDEEYNAFSDYDEIMRDIDYMRNQNRESIKEELKKYLNDFKMTELFEFVEECGDSFNYGIVDKSKIFGEKQTEPYWFRYIKITQHVGYCGDDYSGTIFIPIVKGKYFKFDYEC